jgi:hypothetical protein
VVNPPGSAMVCNPWIVTYQHTLLGIGVNAINTYFQPFSEKRVLNETRSANYFDIKWLQQQV